MDRFLQLIKRIGDGNEVDLYGDYSKEDIILALKEDLHRSKVFYGGFIPTVSRNDSNPLGINTEEFLKYWEGLTLEPAFTMQTEIHGTVDYIFYQEGVLEAVRSLNLPNFYLEMPFKM